MWPHCSRVVECLRDGPPRGRRRPPRGRRRAPLNAPGRLCRGRRGLGNSVNVALNALALAAGANRTLLVSDDRKFRAGFWKYLGAVEDRWPTKDAVLAAWHAGGGCAKCGTCDEKTGAMTEAVRAFFPMKRQCLDDGTCGDGVSWLLCDDALGPGDARLVHVRGAVTWIAPLMLQNERVAVPARAARGALFRQHMGQTLRGAAGPDAAGAWQRARFSANPRRQAACRRRATL
ncbi:hypothetical protein M885DRAFT_112823 [Pelagophyceae sp. CCMP2097]|nr:hypothetical protein M885DRAFT_112823 [Pelagophyceae sp. CCMP2097]